MKIQITQGTELTGSTQPTKAFKFPGTKLPTENGNILVNYHGICFIMTTYGKYIPWGRTLKCGELMKISEYGRLKGLIGPLKLKPLTPFQESCAAVHAAGITADPLYSLTEEEKEIVALNKEAYRRGMDIADFLLLHKAATAEKVDVDEYLRRQAIRQKRAQERKEKEKQKVTKPIAPIVKIKPDHGRSNFFMGSIPGFENLLKKKFG